MNLELAKIKYNKETKEEELVPLIIDSKTITCLYKDRNGVFITTTQGFTHKVAYEIDFLEKKLEL